MSDSCSGSLDLGFQSLSLGQAGFLGFVQGLTELLPVSSTAHMRLVPALLGWPDPGSAFSAVLQLAALGAVLTYFRRDIQRLVVDAAVGVRARDYPNPQLRLALGIVLATVPIVVAGALLAPVLNTCHSPLRGVVVVGWSCLLMAVLLGIAERWARHRRAMADAALGDALLVGLAQAGALIPGVSRSGSTLAAALGLGFRREEAARFSFLLGIPAIGLAGARELWTLRNAGLDGHGWAVLTTSLVTAAVSAFLGIWSLMRVLERFSAWPFVIYRAVLGVLVLVAVWRGWLS